MIRLKFDDPGEILERTLEIASLVAGGSPFEKILGRDGPFLRHLNRRAS